MKRNRKLLALTLSALMTAGLLAGCGAASSTAEAGGTASAAGTAAETGNPGGEDGVFTIILLVAVMVIVVDQITNKLRKELLK